MLEKAAVNTEGVNAQIATNETVIRIPEPPTPQEHGRRRQSGVDITVATDLSGYYVADVNFYASSELASTNRANPGTCGETALTAAKVFVAAVQAGDPSTYERCERTHSLLSADDINSVASGAWVVDNAFVTTQIDPPPAANETVIQIPAPPVPRESQPPQDSGIDIRIATDLFGYYVVNVTFYSST